MNELWVVLGAGGHALTVVDCLLALGKNVAGFLDADVSKRGQRICGIPVLGGDDLLPEVHSSGVTHFTVGVGGTVDLKLRRRLFELGIRAGLSSPSLIHPSAVVSPAASIATGSQVLPLSAINSGAIIGSNAIVNTGAIVEHECRVGDHSHLASGARLAGGVTVEEEVFVGCGAAVRNGVRIGRSALVGMGAVVLTDVPPGTRVYGNPAVPAGRSR